MRRNKQRFVIGWVRSVLISLLLSGSTLIATHSSAQKPTTVVNDDGTYTTSRPHGDGGTEEIVTYEEKIISVVHKNKDGKPTDAMTYAGVKPDDLYVDPGQPIPAPTDYRTWEYDSNGRLVEFWESFPDRHSIRRTIEYSDKNDTTGKSKDETRAASDDPWKPADAKGNSQLNKDIKLDPVREYSSKKRKFHSIVDDMKEDITNKQNSQKDSSEKGTSKEGASNQNTTTPTRTSDPPPKSVPPSITTPSPTPQPNTPTQNTSNLNGYQVETKTANGLSITTFDTPQGKIKVNLPDDMAAGDTISGTVETEPAGKSESERKQNQEALDRYKIAVAGPQAIVSNKRLTVTISTTLSSAARTVGLIRGNQQVAASEIPISQTQPAAPAQIILPTGGQQGKLIEGRGNFSLTDQISIGGAVMPEVAGSPRKKVVRNTSQMLGPTTIKAGQQECPFRNIGIKLSASKLNLQRGETITLQVVVMGLAGIDQALLLNLVNTTSNVIRMSGGDDEQITIEPRQVQADGTCALDRTLTAITTGAFGVTGTIRWTNVCNNPVKIAGLKVIAGLVNVNQPGFTPVAQKREILEGECPDPINPKAKRYGPERLIAVNNDQILTLLAPQNMGTCPIEIYSVDVFGNPVPDTSVLLQAGRQIEGYTAPAGAVKVVFVCVKDKPNGTCILQIDHSERDYWPPRKEIKGECLGDEIDIPSGTGSWSAGDLIPWIKNTGKCPVQIYTVDKLKGKRLDTQPTTIAPGAIIAGYTVSNKGQGRAVDVVYKCPLTPNGSCTLEIDGNQPFPNESLFYAYKRLQGNCDGSPNIISVTNGTAMSLQQLENEGKCPIEIYGIDDARNPVYGNDDQGQPRANPITLQPGAKLAQFQAPDGATRVVLKCKAGDQGPCVLRLLDQELGYLGAANNPPKKESARSSIEESCDSGPYVLSVVNGNPRPVKWLTNEGSCPIDIFDVGADGKSTLGWNILLEPGETIESYYPSPKAFSVRFKCQKTTEDDNGKCKLSYENAKPWQPE